MTEHLKTKLPFAAPALIVALPRGGVAVGHSIATRLSLPLQVLVVRKIGAPNNPEYGVGAITEGGISWLNEDTIHGLGLTRDQVDTVISRETIELHRRVREYRGSDRTLNIRGQNVILVDDGLATGVTARAAIRFLREQGARQITLAIPVGAPDALTELKDSVDHLICPAAPEKFRSVGSWYNDFEQLEDADVIRLLRDAESRQSESLNEIKIHLKDVTLEGTLYLPEDYQSIVVFAHGSGSSRFSPRNQEVAHALIEKGLGTLLFDLLTPAEAEDRDLVFNIPLLAERVRQTVLWLKQQPTSQGRSIGLFGASTGAAAALWAAAELRGEVNAIVSRGGRPDLAQPKLGSVQAPTLLIVGGNDDHVLQLNRWACNQLNHSTQDSRGLAKLLVIPGATHLFEEPGALEKVAHAGADWFKEHLHAIDSKSAA